MLDLIRDRLRFILAELRAQPPVAAHFSPETLSFGELIDQLDEYIEVAGEYGIAYESVVATLEQVPFVLSGKAAVKLLEVGLLLGFKTEDPQDRMFDRRGKEAPG